MTWAKRLERVCNSAVEACGICGGAVKSMAVVEGPVVIRKILDHLETQGDARGFSPVGSACPAKSADGFGAAVMTVRNRWPIRTAWFRSSCCQERAARQAPCPDEASKLDRPRNFCSCSLLETGRWFFLSADCVLDTKNPKPGVWLRIFFSRPLARARIQLNCSSEHHCAQTLASFQLLAANCSSVLSRSVPPRTADLPSLHP